MRRAWPLVLLLVGCRSDVYRGSDLQKVVCNEHSIFIDQQMALLKNGRPAEMIRELGVRAGDPAKFAAFRDKAQALLETSLQVGGGVKSYRIVEAEKIKVEAAPAVTASDGHSVNGNPGTAARDGVIVRIDVQFERASAEFEYTFFLIDGARKCAGLNIKFRAASE
jgi:hypothetical protein